MKKAAFFILFALLTPSHAFSKNPSVFGIKLMTKEAKFLSKNPLCVRNTSELIHENITLDGMDIYDITRNTDDGRLVTLNCCFHKNRLAVIIVNYKDPRDETLHALKYKYGPYSSHIFRRERNAAGTGYDIRETARWASDNSILIFTRILETDSCRLALANSHIQDILKTKKEAYVTKKLE